MKRFLLVSVFTFANITSWCQIRFSEAQKLPIAINSSAEETTPVLSSNGKELYFVRTFDPENLGGENDQDIWRSELKTTGEWSQAENVVELNNELNNCLLGLSLDSKTAFLVNSYGRKSETFKGIAYSSSNQNGDWKKPRSFDLNLEGFESSIFGFSISGNQKTIVFSAKSKNSLSGKDLFISEYKENGWTEPIQLQINSNKDEIAPYLSEKADTLYFSSNGLLGFGNFDLFYCTRNGSCEKWNNPINLGNVINTSSFEAYLTKVGTKIFWSSNRNGNDSDIYFAEIKVPTILAIELSKKDISYFNGNDGQIEIAVISGNPPFKFNWSNGSMVKDLFKLRKGVYRVEVIDATGQKITQTIELSEPPPKLQTYFRLPEVRFEFGTWNFASSKDYDSLNEIAQLLIKNPDIIIELVSHTDSRGNDQVNMELAENRAKAVYTFLVQNKGIDPRRMIPIGKGESQPLEIIDPKSNQKITLSEAYIEDFKNTDNNHFEYLHQLNRRIEARIISFNFNPQNASPAPKEYLIQLK